MTNISEENLNIIYKVAKRISSAKWIPGYTKEDIQQEAIIIGLKGADKYNGSIPFENFISNHIKNRLITLRRDKYIKPGCSCGKCKKCSHNLSRVNIMSPSDISNEDPKLSYNMQDSIASEELMEYLDDFIPAELRDDYIKLTQGCYVNSIQKEKIKAIITEALYG
jgi:DNA-directed RNA polymerase specialized sigma24 family protein